MRSRLLAALPDAKWTRWAPQREQVALPMEKVLNESRMNLDDPYFPTTAIFSLWCMLQA